MNNGTGKFIFFAFMVALLAIFGFVIVKVRRENQ